jgi:5-methyltetrahydrofolate--homocysteine methyltransferase
VEAAGDGRIRASHVRRELGIDAKRGKRYSWGYPAAPIWLITKGLRCFQADELGLELSAACMIPEQSTVAIIVHHPAAKYYSVGVSRVEQLLGN